MYDINYTNHRYTYSTTVIIILVFVCNLHFFHIIIIRRTRFRSVQVLFAIKPQRTSSKNTMTTTRHSVYTFHQSIFNIIAYCPIYGAMGTHTCAYKSNVVLWSNYSFFFTYLSILQYCQKW